MIYWNLFIAFFRIGIFGYGGGPSMIPLFHAECVKKYNWVSAEEFSDALALANALPGPTATKMSAYIGYRVKGFAGALIANLAVFLPVVILMISLLGFMYVLKEHPFIQRMINAIQPVIGVMMAVLAYDFVVKGVKNTSNKSGAIGLLVLSFISISFFKISAGILVAIALAVSFIYSTWITKKQNRQKANKGAGSE